MGDKWSKSEAATVTSETAEGITQLVKPRPPPLWTGQKFDRWKDEVTAWHDNGRGTYEEKFLDLIECLKKTDAIKGFVNRTLIEKVGTKRIVDTNLEIVSEKFDKIRERKRLI